MTNGVAGVENGTNGATTTPDMNREEIGPADGNAAKKNWWTRVADTIAGAYADAFYWVGIRVAEHPKMTILFSIIFVGKSVLPITENRLNVELMANNLSS